MELFNFCKSIKKYLLAEIKYIWENIKIGFYEWWSDFWVTIKTYFPKKERRREEKRKEYFLTCCAFTFIGNSHLGRYDYNKEREKLKEIGKRIGLSESKIEKTIRKIFNIQETESKTSSSIGEENNKNRHTIKYLVKLLIGNITKIFNRSKTKSKATSSTEEENDENRHITKHFVKLLYDIIFLLFSGQEMNPPANNTDPNSAKEKTESSKKTNEQEKREREDIYNFICIKLGIFKQESRDEIKNYISKRIEGKESYESVKEDFKDLIEKYEKYLQKDKTKKVEKKDENGEGGAISNFFELFNLEDLNFYYLRNLNNYFNAILYSIDRSHNKDNYKKLTDIKVDYIKNFEKYWNNLHGDDMSSKQMAELVYDLFSLIWVDYRITDEEDNLFKFCSIICNIRRIKRIKIKNELYKSLQIEKDEKYHIEFNQRRKTIRNIKNTLDKDYTITANEKARFALVCSLGDADNNLDEKERYELEFIGQRDYYLKSNDIEEILNNFGKAKNGNSVYLDFLLHIPEKVEDKFTDLKNCYDIIYLDNKITNAEKGMFEIVCMFYGVGSHFFTSNEYKKHEKGRYIPQKFLKDKDIRGNVKFNHEDYYKINDLLNRETIKEPFISCVEMATRKKFEESQRATMRKDKITTGFTFTIFIISALFLLIKINTIAHHTYYKGSGQEYKVKSMSPIHDTSVAEEFYEYSHKLSEKYCEGISWLLTDVYNFICKIPLMLRYFILAMLLICIFRIRYITSSWIYLKQRHILAIISILLIIATTFIPQTYLPSIFLLAAMLSIEWLILMREKKQEKEKENRSSKLLTVLVISAIFTDISFGMIELGGIYTNWVLVLDKIFSAFFLGCICFFFGKFMELQYNHENEELSKIAGSLGLNNKTPKPETQDEKKTAEDKKPEAQGE